MSRRTTRLWTSAHSRSADFLAAGFGVISGAAWARWLGILFVGFQLITNFLFIPVQPWWAFTLILLDLWVIHAMFVHRRLPT